jgi:hypothetical protein
MGVFARISCVMFTTRGFVVILGNGKFEAVMLLEASEDGIMGSFVECGDVVTLSESDAIAAVKRYLETKQAMASRRTRRGSSKAKRTPKAKAPARESAPSKAKGKGKNSAGTKGLVEFHFTHGFAAKSKMPAPSFYRYFPFVLLGWQSLS